MSEQKSISIKSLKTGDILLSAGLSGISQVIKVFTNSKFSHTALYIGGGNVIEAIDKGVVVNNIVIAMSDDILVSVYRKNDLTPGEAAYVVENAKRYVGKPYDVAGAMGAGVTSNAGVISSLLVSPAAGLYGLYADAQNRKNPTSAFFCSELVAWAYKRSGVILDSNASSATPEDIANYKSLTYLGDLKSPN